MRTARGRIARSGARSARCALSLLSACAALLAGCEKDPPAKKQSEVAARAEPARAPANSTLVLRPFDEVSQCRLRHRGTFIDLGAPMSNVHRSFQLGPFHDRVSAGWADERFTRFFTRQASYDFWQLAPQEAGIALRVRARAGAARRLLVTLDQQRLGVVDFGSGQAETRLINQRTPLERGRHTIGLRWLGPTAPDGVAYGSVEWLHVGTPSPPGQPPEKYSPPQPQSALGDVTLAGTPRRSVILDAPSGLSCPLEIPRDARLELSLGYWGDGAGVAQVAVEREGAAPEVIGERRVRGGADAAWQELTVPLDAYAGQLIRLELRAERQEGSGRLAFAEPRLSVALPPQTPEPRARTVVLLLLAGADRELLPPLQSGLKALGRLVTEGVRFEQYRVPTTLTSSVVASLLTGLPPLAHGLTGPGLALPKSVTTLADVLAGKSGQSALFTGVPHSFAPFGLARGFNHYEAFSPVEDRPASAPIEHATEWLKAELESRPERPRLVVVHARGGHPPWDVSRNEALALPPDDYNGLVDPRRGGIVLSDLRARSRQPRRRLAPADWTRLSALARAALEKQDAALDELIQLLERRGEWQHTLFLVAGDVGPGEPPETPFGQGRALTEGHLVVPLYVKFPGARAAAARVALAPTTSVDLAHSIALALGLSLPEPAQGQSLYQLATSEAPGVRRPLLATLGSSYATRYGRWVLTGTSGSAPFLCEYDVDPACATDRLGDSLLAAETLWRKTASEHQRQRELLPLVAPEGARLDPDTTAALRVFGD